MSAYYSNIEKYLTMKATILKEVLDLLETVQRDRTQIPSGKSCLIPFRFFFLVFSSQCPGFQVPINSLPLLASRWQFLRRISYNSMKRLKLKMRKN